MSEDQIQAIVDEVLEAVRMKKLRFPSPPTVIVRINHLLNSTGSSTADMVKLVQTHAVLAAKLLQVSNSAAINRGAEITSLSDAIQRLGFSFVRNLALSLTLREQFNPVSPLVQQMISEVWDHSVHIGAVGSLMAQYLNTNDLLKVDSSVALLVGVIHSIGEIPLMDFALSKGHPPHLVMALPEKAKQELSVGILEAWDVPESIIDAVRFKGIYGEILNTTHSFLLGDDQDFKIRTALIVNNKFQTFVKEHESTITDLKANFS